jgi:hypothetical protein
MLAPLLHARTCAPRLGPIDTIIQLPWLGHGREGYDIDIQAGLLLCTDHYAECLHCCTETNRSARVGAMLGRPVNAAAARFFSFLCGFFVLLFSSVFSFSFYFFSFFS